MPSAPASALEREQRYMAEILDFINDVASRSAEWQARELWSLAAIDGLDVHPMQLCV